MLQNIFEADRKFVFYERWTVLSPGLRRGWIVSVQTTSVMGPSIWWIVDYGGGFCIETRFFDDVSAAILMIWVGDEDDVLDVWIGVYEFG